MAMEAIEAALQRLEQLPAKVNALRDELAREKAANEGLQAHVERLEQAVARMEQALP